MSTYTASEKLQSHLSQHASMRGERAYLAVVWSEGDDALRAEIEELLGSSGHAGHMSEEHGWTFTSNAIEGFVSAETLNEIFGDQ